MTVGQGHRSLEDNFPYVFGNDRWCFLGEMTRCSLDPRQGELLIEFLEWCLQK